MAATASFQQLQVPTPGFGAMSLSGPYGPADDVESLQLLHRVLQEGCTFWDTAQVYGKGHNESLIGRFLAEQPGAREKLFIGSKCGFAPDGKVTNDPAHIIESLDASTKRLGTAPDLYYLHRIDPDVKLEDSIGALHKLKVEGKVKYIGLSEPSAATLRRACQIAHIDALQIEYSPWYIDHETDGLIDTAKELGVTIIAYSPLGKGVLTGKYRDQAAFKNDIRGEAPRYTEFFQENLKIVEEFERLALKKGCTSGQLSIAWVAAQGAIPIPGTKNMERFMENWGSTRVALSEEEMAEIREVITSAQTKGNRYSLERSKQVGL